MNQPMTTISRATRFCALTALLTLAPALAAQLPGVEQRFDGELTSANAIPSQAGDDKATVCAIYNLSRQQLRIGLLSRDDFVARTATMSELLPNGQVGATVAPMQPQTFSPGTFFTFVTLNRLQEIALLNCRMYVEMVDAAGMKVGGVLKPSGVRRLFGKDDVGGAVVEIEVAAYTPLNRALVDVTTSGAIPTGVEIWNGTAANPGAPIAAVPGGANGEFNGTLQFDDVQIGDLTNGNTFLRATYPDGRRADVDIRDVEILLSFADGSQAGTASTATAKTVVSFSTSGDVEYTGESFGLSGFLGAELREGFFGQTGPLIATLTPAEGMTRIDGSFTPTATQFQQIRQGSTYVVWKTAAFPNGEIRGQTIFEAPLPTMTGDGCPGSNGLLPHLGTTDAPVTLGTEATFMITNALPNVPCWLLISASAPPQTPWNLDVLGMPDCFMFLNVDIAVTGMTDANGTADFTMTIPSSFVPGLSILQAGQVDPSANALGFTMTNALFAPLN